MTPRRIVIDGMTYRLGRFVSPWVRELLTLSGAFVRYIEVAP